MGQTVNMKAKLNGIWEEYSFVNEMKGDENCKCKIKQNKISTT